jgi:hypothetical protein
MTGRKKNFIILICMVALFSLGLSEAGAWKVTITNPTQMSVEVNIATYTSEISMPYSTARIRPGQANIFDTGAWAMNYNPTMDMAVLHAAGTIPGRYAGKEEQERYMIMIMDFVRRLL